MHAARKELKYINRPIFDISEWDLIQQIWSHDDVCGNYDDDIGDEGNVIITCHHRNATSTRGSDHSNIFLNT